MSWWNPLENLKRLGEPDKPESDESYIVSSGEDAPSEDDLMQMGLMRPLVGISGVDQRASDHVIISGQFVRSLYIEQYPTQARPGWLDHIFQFPYALDVSLFIEPWDRDEVIKQLKRRVDNDELKIINAQQSGRNIDFNTKERFRRNMQLLEAIEGRDTALYNAGVLITIRANTLEELNTVTAAVEREFISPTKTTIPEMQQLNAFLTGLPLAQRKLSHKEMMKQRHTASLLTMFPFGVSNLTHPSGVWMGVDEKSGSNVIINRFLRERGLPNPHQLVLGYSGSGKSYLTKAEIYQYRMLGVPVVVIDPLNEYQRLCGNMGGSWVPLSESSDLRINPLDFSHAVQQGAEGKELSDKISSVISLIGVMLRIDERAAISMDASQRNILEKALTAIYRRYNYQLDYPESFSGPKVTSERMPTLGELFDTLEKLSQRGDTITKASIRPMLEGLRSFVGDGAFAGLFDHKSNIDLANPFVVFNIRDVSELMRPAVMQMVLDFLRTNFFTQRQKESGQRRLFYVDEAHMLMGSPDSARFLEYVARTARQFNIGLTIITQDVKTFSKSEVGSTILGMMTTKILMKQQPSEVPSIQAAFDLTNGEAQQIRQIDTGHSLMIVGADRAWVNHLNILSPHAHQLAQSQKDVTDLNQLGAASNDDDILQLPPA